MLESVVNDKSLLDDKQLLKTVYVTPMKFAECIDSIFSNNADKVAHYFGVKSDRDNISVDMFMEWLREEGSNYAESVGFVSTFYEKSNKVQELKSDLETEIQRLEKLGINTETSSEEELRTITALECYSRVLNQLSD